LLKQTKPKSRVKMSFPKSGSQGKMGEGGGGGACSNAQARQGEIRTGAGLGAGLFAKGIGGSDRPEQRAKI